MSKVVIMGNNHQLSPNQATASNSYHHKCIWTGSIQAEMCFRKYYKEPMNTGYILVIDQGRHEGSKQDNSR